MRNYATTRARSKGALLPPPGGQWGLVEATVVRAMVSSPSPTADEVDRLYCQLTEIHAIGATQFAECAHYRRSDSTPSIVRARTSRQCPDGMPSVTRTAPPPLTSFFSQVLL
jgi:hypothetical protein